MIRLALIGCGGIAKAHRARFEAVADRMRVAVTVDIDRARAEEARETLGAESAVTDFQDALPHVDAVLIATPHHEHHPIGMACLNAKKHVLMEKPLANTEGQCLDLIEAAEANGVTLMTAYCMRYHPLTVEMARLIHKKAYGERFHVSLWTEQFTRFEEGSWAHGVETLGGGQFFSHGCHYVDILLHFLGEPVSGVHVGTNFGTPWMEREGTSDAFIKFAGGAVGYHGGTWGAQGTRLGYAFHAHCTDGMIEADFFAGTLKLLRSGQPDEVLLQTDKSSKYMDREMSHFLDCIETGATPITNGPESLQGLRVIWRLYNGEDEGRIADLRGLGLKNDWRFRSPETLSRTKRRAEILDAPSA